MHNGSSSGLAASLHLKTLQLNEAFKTALCYTPCML